MTRWTARFCPSEWRNTISQRRSGSKPLSGEFFRATKLMRDDQSSPVWCAFREALIGVTTARIKRLKDVSGETSLLTNCWKLWFYRSTFYPLPSNLSTLIIKWNRQYTCCAIDLSHNFSPSNFRFKFRNFEIFFFLFSRYPRNRVSI